VGCAQLVVVATRVKAPLTGAAVVDSEVPAAFQAEIAVCARPEVVAILAKAPLTGAAVADSEATAAFQAETAVCATPEVAATPAKAPLIRVVTAAGSSMAQDSEQRRAAGIRATVPITLQVPAALHASRARAGVAATAE
jgi:hypothetical protein